MKQNPPEIKTDEDFSTSMARLAELAAQGIVSEKPKDDKLSSIEDELLKEYLKPKRVAKKKQAWQDAWLGNAIKIKINPYVAAGILVILLSSGFLATPHILKYIKERNQQSEQQKIAKAKISAQTEGKLKSYTVFDAAKDSNSQGGTLKAHNLADLAKSVAETNQIALQKAEEQKLLDASNALNNIDVGNVEDSISENDELVDNFLLNTDQINTDQNWSLRSEPVTSSQDLDSDLEQVAYEFDWQNNYHSADEIVSDDALFLDEILASMKFSQP